MTSNLDTMFNPPDTNDGYSGAATLVHAWKLAGETYNRYEVTAGGVVRVGDGTVAPTTVIDGGLEIADLAAAPATTWIDGLGLIDLAGTAYKVTYGELNRYGFLGRSPTLISANHVMNPLVEEALISTSAGAINIDLPNLTDAQLSKTGPVTVVQFGAGKITFVAGANTVLATTGTNRHKTRATFAVVRAVPLFNIAPNTYWTITGDTDPT